VAGDVGAAWERARCPRTASPPDPRTTPGHAAATTNPASGARAAASGLRSVPSEASGATRKRPL